MKPMTLNKAKKKEYLVLTNNYRIHNEKDNVWSELKPFSIVNGGDTLQNINDYEICNVIYFSLKYSDSIKKIKKRSKNCKAPKHIKCIFQACR